MQCEDGCCSKSFFNRQQQAGGRCDVLECRSFATDHTAQMRSNGVCAVESRHLVSG